jgi:hypothetical protein
MGPPLPYQIPARLAKPDRNRLLAHVWSNTWYCLGDKDLRQALVGDATP